MILPRREALMFAAALGALAGAAGAGYKVADLQREVEVSKLKVEVAEGRAERSAVSLEAVSAAADRVEAAALQYARDQAALSTGLANIRRDLKNVTTKLPADCRPDAVRVRMLNDAVDRVRQSASTSAGFQTRGELSGGVRP